MGSCLSSDGGQTPPKTDDDQSTDDEPKEEKIVETKEKEAIDPYPLGEMGTDPLIWFDRLSEEAKLLAAEPDTTMTEGDCELLLDRSYGCVIGAAIGDSMGSYVEFAKERISDEQLGECLKMPGGGPHGIAPGQVTDDTEMAVCGARGYVEYIGRRKKKTDLPFNGNDVANEYNQWFEARPFDYGRATQSTVGQTYVARLQRKYAKEYNTEQLEQWGGNKANGSVMRCMPVIVFGQKLNREEFVDLMVADASLSHANPSVYVMEAAYGIAAQYLLTNPSKHDRHREAFKVAQRWVQSTAEGEDTRENREGCAEAAKEVKEWLDNCEKGDTTQFEPVLGKIGYVRIAFERTFYYLYKKTDFVTALKETIVEGGDTDTNACIVGGMLGALYGLKALPKPYLSKMIDVVAKKTKEEFQARKYFDEDLVLTLVKDGPNDLICSYVKKK